jgi:hypothetical protein
VLRLVAEGLPTREVAQQLSYSERTIKAVMQDVTTKLHAKRRSQAVALAVREGSSEYTGSDPFYSRKVARTLVWGTGAMRGGRW